MRIVEIGDCSMVIMKDSEDPPWVSVGNIYRQAKKYDCSILVDVDKITENCSESSDFVYTAGRLILFFKDDISSKFHLHDKVEIMVG